MIHRLVYAHPKRYPIVTVHLDDTAYMRLDGKLKFEVMVDGAFELAFYLDDTNLSDEELQLIREAFEGISDADS